jgi:hypothetical protein
MHSAHLNDLYHMRELQPHAAPTSADQEKPSLCPVQFCPIRVSSLVIRPAMSRIGTT